MKYGLLLLCVLLGACSQMPETDIEHYPVVPDNSQEASRLYVEDNC